MKNQREISYDILVNKQYANLELKKLSNHPHKSFITRLVYTCYQQDELLKFQYSDLLHTTVPDEIETILLMAAAQKYFFNQVEDYALVNESVNLAKKVNRKYSNLVNAVLKKMIQRELRYSNSGDEVLDLSINTSHPIWMTKLLIAQYGLQQTKDLLHHHNTQPPLYIRLNEKKIEVEEALTNYPIYKIDNQFVADSTVFRTDALENGLMLVQDRNSQQLINNIKFNADDNVLDACTAPGTKLTQMADQVLDGQCVGVDVHEHRIELTRQLVERWGNNNVELITSDILDYETDQQFDKILCDVPCSGLGVIRRKPDLKRRIHPEDLDALELLQAQILNHVKQFLKIGGQLIYSTCTLNKKENQKQVEKFLKDNPAFTCLSEETLWGPQNDGDSFYEAILVKKQ